MNTLSRLTELISARFGVKPTRIENVARRLQEAGMLPAGGPGRAPILDRHDALVLLVAVGTGAKLDDVAEATAAALATTPGGSDVTDAPRTIPRTAEINLAVLAGMAADGEDLTGLTIEIVNSWPEIAFIWEDGVVHRYQAAGTIPNYHPDRSRWELRVTGAAFSQFVRSLT